MSYKKVKSFFLKKRRIQVHLVVIFLVLLIGSSGAITRYTYDSYRQDIENLSLTMVNQASKLFAEKVLTAKKEVRMMLEVIKGSMYTKAQITGKDKAYSDFLLNIVREDPVITDISMATPDGDYFSILDVQFQGNVHFNDHFKGKVPEGTRYVIRTLHKTGETFKETWAFLDVKGDPLSEEAIPFTDEEAKQDPWVLDEMKSPTLHWSKEIFPRGVESSEEMGDYGITLTDVVKDAEGNIFGMLSVSVSLRELSDFLLAQKIGNTGSAFIIDNNWVIKVPVEYGSTYEQAFRKGLAEDAYQEYKKTNKKDFSLVKDGKEYLFSIRSYMNLNSEWFILIIVPFDDLFGFIVKTENHTRLMSLFTIILAAIAIFYSSKYFSKPIVALARIVDKIRDFDFKEPVPINSRIQEVFDLEASVSAMRSAVKSFGRYIPKEVVKALVKHGEDVHLGGKRLELTIMFSDVENFTTVSESLPMEELMTILSDYFDVISRVVLDSDGTIDKYIGDSLMAFWGAPLAMPNHAEKACEACLKCLIAVKTQGKWVTRFGIHTGEVIVGNIGTSERINYTVIGDAVNVASRLEGINKDYNTSIMISEVVQEGIGPFFVTRPVDFVAVKGKRKKLRIFELMGTTEGVLAVSKEQLELSNLFKEAYTAFEEERKEEAIVLFTAIEKKFPEDVPTKKYLERLKEVSS